MAGGKHVLGKGNSRRVFGTAKVGDTTFPIEGECEGSTLDLTLTIGIVTVEFEGIKR